MIFKPGDVVRAKFGTWHSNYEGRCFMVLESQPYDEIDIEVAKHTGVSGNKYILLDNVLGGRIHAFDSELELLT